jgi:dsRNA-specific ribonuclease
MSEEMADLEIAGYNFRDAELLATALTHSSYLHEHVGKGVRDFERLEFLGDAVVDLVIGEELYRRFPEATEGELTSLARDARVFDRARGDRSRAGSAAASPSRPR